MTFKLYDQRITYITFILFVQSERSYMKISKLFFLQNLKVNSTIAFFQVQWRRPILYTHYLKCNLICKKVKNSRYFVPLWSRMFSLTWLYNLLFLAIPFARSRLQYLLLDLALQYMHLVSEDSKIIRNKHISQNLFIARSRSEIYSRSSKNMKKRK